VRGRASQREERETPGPVSFCFLLLWTGRRPAGEDEGLGDATDRWAGDDVGSAREWGWLDVRVCDGGLVGRFLFRPTWDGLEKGNRIDSCTVRGSSVKKKKED
jgi:hypothetical protein